MATKIKTQEVTIGPPNFGIAEFAIKGTAPYCQHRFFKKGELEDKHRAGSTTKKGAKREKRNFESEYEQAKHISDEGWVGIPAAAFRNALISACRIVGFQMTKAKLAMFVLADGIDPRDKTPLVEIEGEPEMQIDYVRNTTGVVDLRARPVWAEWAATVKIRYDADMFTLADVTNLLARVGMQVGIGEGRPDSKKSAGLGWGTFEVTNEE